MVIMEREGDLSMRFKKLILTGALVATTALLQLEQRRQAQVLKMFQTIIGLIKQLWI